MIKAFSRGTVCIFEPCKAMQRLYMCATRWPHRAASFTRVPKAQITSSSPRNLLSVCLLRKQFQGAPRIIRYGFDLVIF